jgi:hypothetical protein
LKSQPADGVIAEHRRAVERAADAGFATPEQAASLANALALDAAGRAALNTAACPVNLMKMVCGAMEREKSRWEAVRAAIVRVATDEFESTWNRGTRTESQAAMRSVIETYWRDGVYEGGAIPADIGIPSEAWSSAFIAWVVLQAGGGSRFSKVGDEANYRPDFRPRAHWRYVAPSKINRETNSGANPFWAFAIDEERPQEGDIVVRSRAGSRATFNAFEGRRTHGDVVIAVGTSDITVIGGNAGGASNTVARTNYALNADGFVDSTGGGDDDHFAIVRIHTAMFDLLMCDLVDRGAQS